MHFYDHGELIKTHPRQPPGGRSIDAHDYPPHKSAYAMRDLAFLEREAGKHGEAIGRFAHALLEGPLPWTRMRRVYALLGLVRRYGDARVEDACHLALDAEMYDVKRLQRMLQAALSPPTTTPPPQPIAPARHLRPASHFALPLSTRDQPPGEPS